jgi:hypothetical protein
MAAAAPFAQIVEAANVAATAAERRMEPQILLICGFFPKNWTTTGSFLQPTRSLECDQNPA